MAIERSILDDPNVKLTLRIIDETLGAFAYAAYTCSTELVGPGVAVTLDPVRPGAAPLFLLIEPGAGVTLLVGESRVRFEIRDFKNSYTDDASFSDELRELVESIVLGRVTDDVATARSGRVARVRTVVTLADGRRVGELSVRKPFAFRTKRTQHHYRPYSDL